MAFTAGYKVNEDTQFEFTVSDETIQEMVQVEGGITNSDLTEYCYTALIDSRVYRLFAAQGAYAGDGGQMPGWALTACPGIVEGYSGPMTGEHPTFNKQLLDTSDQIYQRNFLVWEGTIYPGTENEKTGTFLVMDMADIKRWYVNFDGAGFGTTNVTSAIAEEAPEGYVWPGYTGQIYTYAPNDTAWPVMRCDNNDPHLNPNTNIKVKNVLIVNDELWIGSLNPGSGSQADMGGSGCSYAAKSIWGFYWSGNAYGGYLTTTGMRGMYQRGSINFMGLPDYSSAPELPGGPRNDIGSLGYACYAVTNSDNVVVNLAGNWGQQNYASGCNFVNNSATTQLTSVLKWQSWCGLKFQYQDTMYKPIIEGGVIVGYSDDMDAESEYDDMTNVTGNNISPYPPVPPPSPEDDSDWGNIPINGAGIGGGSAFCRFYYCTEAELANLRTWTMGLSEHGDPIPGGFDPKSNIIGLTVFPFTVSGNGPTTIKFTTNGGQDPVTGQPMPRVVDSGVSCEGGTGATISKLNATINVPATMKSRGEPWLDYESYIELYIPMCGVYQVDPQVVIGRTIHVEIFLDPVSGTVMGIAWVPKDSGKCIIAQGSGTPGVQIPVAVGNYGLAQAARVQNTLGAFGNTANSAISTTMVSNAFQNRAGERSLNGIRKISHNVSASDRVAAFNRSGSAILGFSGLVSSAQHWVSARQIANSPGTSASGGFSGSMAEWCGVFKPYVKIVRPKFRKPSNYKHTCGEPEVTTRKINSTGYAVCINPDVSGLTNATEAERAAVYQYLSTGVYYK